MNDLNLDVNSISVSLSPSRQNKHKIARSSTPKYRRSKTPDPEAAEQGGGRKKRKKGKRDSAKHRVVASDIVLPLDSSFTKRANKKCSQTPGGTMDFDADSTFDFSQIAPAKKSKGRPKSTRRAPRAKQLPSSGTDLVRGDSMKSIKGSKRGHRSSQSARISEYAPTIEYTLKHSKTERICGGKASPKAVRLTNSKSITAASKSLTVAARAARRLITDSFNNFHDRLDGKQDLLMEKLGELHDDKKEDLSDAETKLFSNAKRSKKAKEILFYPELLDNVILDEEAILKLIDSDKFGYIEFVEGADFGTEPAAALRTTSQPLSAIADAIDSEPDEDSEEGDETPAMTQKKVLGGLQQKTMSSLDAVIEMERLARRKKREAERLTAEVEERLKHIAVRSKEVDEKLAAARPQLEKAREAVANIDPRDLNEIKALKKPPLVIANVMTATAIILGHKIKEWKDVQRILSNKFKPQLINFDTYTLTKELRQRVYRKYASKETFTFERVNVANKVCGNLVLWVKHQISYSRILDIIIPLEKELEGMKKEVKKKQKLQKRLFGVVAELEKNIELYSAQCNQMIDRIIKTTESELQNFSAKLAPLNAKFQELLKQTEQCF